MHATCFRPYIKDAQKILTKARELDNPRILQSKLNFLHLAIIDGSITTDSAISRLADDCCDRVRAGEKMYIMPSHISISIHVININTRCCQSTF